jgi:pyruvate dehydrogenase E2 component (dihydrolipoamide acetyltransferase)
VSDIYPIAVPKWGIEMVEGTVNLWHKQVGDPVAKGEEIFEMESDKIVNVWESPADGILRRVMAEEGDTHQVGQLLGVIASAEVDDEAIDNFIAEFSKGVGTDGKTGDTPSASAASSAPTATGGDANTRSTPAVRQLAQDLGVDLNSVTGTGRRGRITEDDVRAAVPEQNETSDSGDNNVDVIPLTPTRKTIARRLTSAKQDVPHYYLTVEYELDKLLAHRNKLNESGGAKISVNDMIIWCVSRALIREPRVNVNLVNDDIHQFRNANISVAIATDDGLYPVTLRQAEKMSPADIAAATKQLAEKANSGTLTKEDITGGSFTVSNLGMFGVNNFTAIINPPMGAILALGKGEQRVVVKGGEPAVATVISATLSCDHRIIDGAVGAQFLQALGDELAGL